MAREKVGALVMLLFSIAYGIGAFNIPLTFLAQQEVFNSRTMPIALSVLGIIFSLAMLILPTVDESGKASLSEVTKGMDWKRTILLIIFMTIYGLVMKWIGFILASILFLMAGYRVLGEKRIHVILLASIPLVLILWAIMSLLLGVYIAPGEIFYMLGIL
jgi:putative tricarboxylic transport membrane protein